MKWQQAIRLEEIAGLPIDEQLKVAFLMLSHVDEMDSRFLFIIAKVILREIVDRGEWETLGKELARAIRRHLTIRHMGRTDIEGLP